MKAIIKGAHFSGYGNFVTRHATPAEVVHIITEGVHGRGVLAAVDPAASGLFIFGHPTLGDWSSVPALAKSESGGLLHTFCGEPSVPPDPLSAEDFAQLYYIELLVRGHIAKFRNGHGRSRAPFVGIKIDNTTLLDSLLPQFVPWRSDVTPWKDAPDEYKNDDGSPRVDL